MKISREWLQTYFEKELPSAAELADALTFHAFEIERVEGNVLDVKVTANRGHDCLCHRGIAKELSAILKLPLKSDPLSIPARLEPKTDKVRVMVEDATLCPRFTGAYITGMKVGPSPAWLRERLEALGQKSINNVVDATNYVMFDIGQPLHAFDAGKLTEQSGSRALTVRLARGGEGLVGLDDKEYALSPSMLIIEDAHAGVVASIAGIKGGKSTGIDEQTTEMILEAANWDGVTIRKTSTALKLRTDASDRFQQVISPELAAYGTRAAADLIATLTGGTIVGFFDEYPVPQVRASISLSVAEVNNCLGGNLSAAQVEDVFIRLGFAYEKEGDTFIVTPPFERLDLMPPAGGAEDLIEEIGRIVGYDVVPETELPAPSVAPVANMNFLTAEGVRETLTSSGYSEVYTSVFAEKGEKAVLNKVGGERPFLRTTLVDGLKDALARNVRVKDLLGLTSVKLFEIGTVWKGGEEIIMTGIAEEGGRIAEEPLSAHAARAVHGALPLSKTERYVPFSRYPYIVRDVSFWVPGRVAEESLYSVIRDSAGPLAQRIDRFDRFEKGDKVSYAFRIVLQSFEKTLTDEEANNAMERVYAALRAQGFEIR